MKNVFIIPSWVPSTQLPFKGIFFKEQAEIFARYNPGVNICMSLWGQDDSRLMLWIRDHIGNLQKIISSGSIKETNRKIQDNYYEFFTPAFTWSRMILNGNMSNIIKANLENLKKFESTFGQIDILHAHVGFPAGYIACELSQQLNIPYIVTEHMSPLPFQGFKTRSGDWMPALKKAYANAQAIIALTETQKKIFENQGFSHVTVINNFIDDNKFIPVDCKTPVVIKFLTIAGMHRQKGIDILLKAISLISDRIQEIEFNFVGDGEELDAYKKLSHDLNISHKARLLGELDRHSIAKAIQASDVFILPSRHESFGVVVIEALACGKPCIVTRCGGPEEIVSDEVGIVVEKEDPEALANAILIMTANFKNYIPEKIRAYYEENFSAKRTVEKLRLLYERVAQAYQ